MLKRQTKELNLVFSNEPKPTVEVCAESCEAAGLDVTDALESVLSRFARKNPHERATVSLCGSMSVNFHEPGWSEFLIVDGSTRVLHAVASAFSGRPPVKSRFSDYIVPLKGQPLFHIEDGRCWHALDPMTWGSQENREPNADSASGLSEEVDSTDGAPEDGELVDAWADGDDSVENSGPSDVPKRGRLRAARSDASVGSIKQTIEQLFGLPEGSVALCGPDRKALRADATIATLRRRWEA